MAALQLVAREVEVAGRRLSLLVPRSADDLLDEVLAGGGTVPPYWADLWPSSRALATLLLEGDDLAGRRVLELGCGVGLPSVAALLAGGEVLATDAEPAAIRIAARNARRCGGRRVATMVVDVVEPPGELFELEPFELVLAADVLYEERLGDALGRLLPRVTAPDGEAIIAYPFAGQGDRLAATLEAAGWRARTEEELVPGWREGQTTVRLLRLSPAG
jgi:predicted nicotinamide N-methyase